MRFSRDDALAMKMLGFVTATTAVVGGLLFSGGFRRFVSWVVAGSMCVAVGVFYARARKNSDAQRDAARSQLEGEYWTLVDNHRNTLIQRFRHLVKVDPYGGRDYSKWEKEWASFFVEHVECYLQGHDIPDRNECLLRLMMEGEASIANDVARRDRRASEAQVDVDALNPIEFEAYCAQVLCKAGWEARATQASGDQGIDVIAIKDGFTIVLQVKKYTGTVGNDAVQQIVAGRQFQRASGAVVVCTTAYTKSARSLASRTNVLLLHHEDLFCLSPHDFDAVPPTKRTTGTSD